MAKKRKTRRQKVLSDKRSQEIVTSELKEAKIALPKSEDIQSSSSYTLEISEKKKSTQTQSTYKSTYTRDYMADLRKSIIITCVILVSELALFLVIK